MQPGSYLQPSCWLWQETPCSSSRPAAGSTAGASTQCVSVGGTRHQDPDRGLAASGSIFSFTLQTVGAAGSLGSSRAGAVAAGITWQIENASAGRLTISVQDAQPPARVQLQFPCQLFPGAVVLPAGGAGRVSVAGLTADGRLFCADLEVHQGALAPVQQGHVRFVDLAGQWPSLGSPTQLLATPEHLAVAGTAGSVLCLPTAALVDPAATQLLANDLAAFGTQLPASSRTFLLKESSWGIKSLIAGVWQRPRTPSVVALMHLPTSTDPAGLLLAVYDDCTLVGFSLSRQAQVFTEVLPGCSQGKRSTPVHASLSILAAPHAPHGHMQAALVVQLEASDTLLKSVQLSTLSFPAAGGKPSLKHHLQLASSPQASVIASHSSETATWVLYRHADGSNSLVRYTVTGDGQPVGVAQLLEAAMLPAGGPAGSTAASGLGDAMAMAIWEDLLSCTTTAAAAADGTQPQQQQQQDVVQQQVLGRMLAPGCVDPEVVCDTLRRHGVGVSSLEVECAGLPQLQGMLTAAVDAIQHRSPGWSRARCWAQLLVTYQDTWRKVHPLLGLVPHPQRPDSMATLRGGGQLSLLRPATVVEGLAAPPSLSACVPGVQCTLVTLPHPVAVVHAAAQQLSGLLGPWAQDAARVVMTGRAQQGAQLAAMLAGLLQAGGSGGPQQAAGDDVARAQRSAWRGQRQQLLLQVSAALAGLPDPAAAIREYCSLLSLHSQLPQPAAANTSALWPTSLSQSTARGQHAAKGQPLATATTICMREAARQVAAGQAAVCRDALLLLQLLASQQLVGVAPRMPPQALAALKSTTLQEVSDLCSRAAVVLWLCITPASAVPSKATESPSHTALAALRLGSPAPTTPPAPNPRASLHTGTSLLTQLLPVLTPALNLPQGADVALCEHAAPAAVQLLQYAPGGGTSVPLQDTLLTLGYWLFAAQEVAALAGLSQLAVGHNLPEASTPAYGRAGPGPAGARSAGARSAGATAADAGLLLLQALSLASQLRAAATGARAGMVARASACFFSAATGLHAGGSRLLIQVLHQLTSHLTGIPAPATSPTLPLSPTAAAALQLQLYEAAMQVFEREGAPDGALTFARAALQHSHSAALASSHEAPVQPPGAEDTVMEDGQADENGQAGRDQQAVQAERLQRDSRLWSNIFTYSCELGAWEDAYAALVCNPDAQEGLACLRKLVVELCEARQLGVLCALPLAGAVELPDDVVSGAVSAATDGGAGPAQRTTLVTLRDEAVAALQRRAINSELSVQPQPYRVLYDFLVARSEYREAAATMLAYARRLRQEGARTTAMQRALVVAYELVVHGLSLVAASEAWLDLGSPWLAAHPLASGTAAPLFAPSGPHSEAGGGAAHPLSKGAQRCCTLAALKRELAVVRAAVQAQTAAVAANAPGPDSLQHPLRVPDVLAPLLAQGLYGAAEQLCAEGLQAGSEEAVEALTQLVSALASAAARAQLQGVGQVPQPLSLLVRDPQEQQQLLGCSHLASPAGPLWNKLRLLLHTYAPASSPAATAWAGAAAAPASSSSTGPGGAGLAAVLRAAAADAILRVDPRMALPVWLQQLFTEGAPGEASAGMAVAGCGPAQLLDVYLAHDRLPDAVHLVCEALAGWGRVDPRQRTRHAAVWYPHARIKVLRGRLVAQVERGSTASGQLLTQLDEALSAHAELLAQDAVAVAAAVAAAGTGAGAMQTGS